jgi:hypothetical protein
MRRGNPIVCERGIKESSRTVKYRHAMKQLLRRSLWANRGFTFTIVAVLALGIGANTAMFTVVNAVLLRPIPWEESGRLVLVREVNRKQGGDFINPSTANYVDWREQSHVFEGWLVSDLSISTCPTIGRSLSECKDCASRRSSFR